MKRIRDEVWGTKHERDQGASPLDLAIGQPAVETYDAALQRLRPDEREAIVARIELDYTYDEVARALGESSADAARVAVSRALLRLAEEMSRAQS
jgi:RNA polymerase sigma-70 factor (ECF subfamily)